MDRADWLEQRRQGVGASDAPAILGVSPYEGHDALSVWWDKVEPQEYTEQTPEQEAGHVFEAGLLRWVQETQVPGVIDFEQYLGRHPDRIRMATFDALAGPACDCSEDDDYGPVVCLPDHMKGPSGWYCPRCGKRHGTQAVVQCKTVGRAHLDAWGDPDDPGSVPAHVLVQVHQEMDVAGCKEALIPVGFSDYGFRVALYRVPYNEKLGGIIRDRVVDFWQHNVQGRVQPAVSGVSARRLLKMVRREAEVAVADSTLVRAAAADQLFKLAKDIRDTCRGELLQEMGDADRATCAFGTAKVGTRRVKSYTVKAREDRILTVKPHKGPGSQLPLGPIIDTLIQETHP